MDSDFRAFLRSRAQTIPAVVMVGKEGCSDRVAAHLDAALRDHELVKIKFVHHKEDMEAILHSLADKTGGTVVTSVGFQGVVWRDGEKHIYTNIYKDRKRRSAGAILGRNE